MPTYELTWDDQPGEQYSAAESGGLESAVLIQNARWFTFIRWIVVAVLLAAGLAGWAMRGPIARLGIVPPLGWPWLLAGILAAANAVFCVLVRRLADDTPRQVIKANIWSQIACDLLIVTALVHIVGSLDTYFSFTYLFHIALACIFFPRRESLVVTMFAACLYLGCVGLELGGILAGGGMLAGSLAPAQRPLVVSLGLAGSAVGVWFVVWYLASTLSEALQKRGRQLRQANQRLLLADQEKNLQVLRVTHDLKAPFSGIESNIQVLRLEHWDEMSQPVRDLIERIQARGQALSERIRDILLLGDLRSRARPSVLEPVDIRAVMDDVLSGLKGSADSRRVAVDVDVPALRVLGEKKPLTVLFANLVANAILYSREGGRVEIRAAGEAGAVRVTVRDQGIGIAADALPHVFQEFYRTTEAARFNRLSTGLGLAIVRTVARHLGLKVSVDSEEGKGTEFKVLLRAAGEKGDGGR